MKVKIVSVCAWGYSHSSMKILTDDVEFNVYISRDVYYYLRNKGVPTAQSLSRKKVK